MRIFQNMHIRNSHLKCVFNKKNVLKTNKKEEGKHQAESVKIVKYQAKFSKICA